MILAIIIFVWTFFAPGCMTFRDSDVNKKNEFRQKGLELRTAFIKVEGRNIHYAETGDRNKPTLIFIHGTPGSWDAFAGYLQDSMLLSRYRMVSIDRPGFGYSDFGQAENLETQSKLLVPVLKKLDNGQPAYLIGHSLGGPMIVKLAAEMESKFSGLVIISGSMDPAVEKPEKWRPVLFSTPLNYLVPGAFRPSNVELWYLKKDLVKLKPSYAEIRCPVYFIHGDKDTWVPPSNVAYAKKLFTNATQISELMLEGGNHFIPWTRFNEIRQVLLTMK
jgi:pimeloyl-ACP methyl ester carboxylesterase